MLTLPSFIMGAYGVTAGALTLLALATFLERRRLKKKYHKIVSRGATPDK